MNDSNKFAYMNIEIQL